MFTRWDALLKLRAYDDALLFGPFSFLLVLKCVCVRRYTVKSVNTEAV